MLNEDQYVEKYSELRNLTDGLQYDDIVRLFTYIFAEMLVAANANTSDFIVHFVGVLHNARQSLENQIAEEKQND